MARTVYEPLDHLRIDGELWGKAVHLTLAPDARESRLWATLAIGNDVAAELEPHELLTVAWAGQAVSDATSFFAPGGATPACAPLRSTKRRNAAAGRATSRSRSRRAAPKSSR